MSKLFKYSLQTLSYAAFMAVVWYFSTAPAYQQLEAEEALVVVAFKHAGQLVEECRKSTAEELENLSANMRRPMVCPRERSPILLEVIMDGKVLFKRTENPPGLYNDGSVSIYYSARVPVGTHKFNLKMNDSVRDEGYAVTHTEDAVLAPSQILMIDFNTENGFVIK